MKAVFDVVPLFSVPCIIMSLFVSGALHLGVLLWLLSYRPGSGHCSFSREEGTVKGRDKSPAITSHVSPHTPSLTHTLTHSHTQHRQELPLLFHNISKFYSVKDNVKRIEKTADCREKIFTEGTSD